MICCERTRCPECRSHLAIEKHFAGKGYGVLKQEVADVVIETLRPIREQFETLIADVPMLDEFLSEVRNGPEW